LQKGCLDNKYVLCPEIPRFSRCGLKNSRKENLTPSFSDKREWHAELKEKEAILGEILRRLKAV
jgi:hypothetical protein